MEELFTITVSKAPGGIFICSGMVDSQEVGSYSDKLDTAIRQFANKLPGNAEKKRAPRGKATASGKGTEKAK